MCLDKNNIIQQVCPDIIPIVTQIKIKRANMPYFTTGGSVEIASTAPLNKPCKYRNFYSKETSRWRIEGWDGHFYIKNSDL